MSDSDQYRYVYSPKEQAAIRADLRAMNEEARKVWETSPKRGLHPRVAAILAQRDDIIDDPNESVDLM